VVQATDCAWKYVVNRWKHIGITHRLTAHAEWQHRFSTMSTDATLRLEEGGQAAFKVSSSGHSTAPRRASIAASTASHAVRASTASHAVRA